MVDLQSSPLIPASPSQMRLPNLVAPATLQQAAQMNPMQAMLAQYGMSIPTQQELPQNFMFSDQPGIPGIPGTGGFGYRHPALATGIENAVMGAAMTPGGLPTAGQNMAQVAGSLAGVPQWRLQRRIGMTLAPLEIAGSMQNILSQQAQAQGQLMSGQGAVYRGLGYMGMGEGRQMEAQAMANRVGNLMDMWNKNPKQAQQFMDANADMIQKERLSNPLFYLYSSKGPAEAKKYAQLSSKLSARYGQMTTPEFFYNVFRSGNKKDINAAMMAMKQLAPFFTAQAKAGLFQYGSQFNPYTNQPYNPGEVQTPQQALPIPGFQNYLSPTPAHGSDFGPEGTPTPENPVPGMGLPQGNTQQPFGNLGQ